MSTAFRISLDGAQQVPVVMSSATGLGVAIFDSATTSLNVTVHVKGMDWGPLLGQPSETPSVLDDVNGVHIHNAARGANGGIVLDWPGGGDADDFAVSAVLADGSRTLTSNWETTDVQPITPFAAAFAAAMLGADVPFYVNIHTGANPGGEIRGQLVAIATTTARPSTAPAATTFCPASAGTMRSTAAPATTVSTAAPGPTP
jgi:serralysin